jgi:glucose-1-phosphate thymidylyltransferase
VIKGIILAGGTGSRLYPLTKITNKHLLPIHDRPMVTYALEALVQADVTEIMMVTGGTHAGEVFRLLGDGHEYGVSRLSYAYQERAGGIAEALGMAARFADGHPVVVMLADNIFERSLRPAIDAFRQEPHGARVVLTELTDPAHLSQLGVPEFGPDGRIVRIVEKPPAPPSPYAGTGVYCYDPSVFDVVLTLAPSGRGELEITDVNNHYVREGTLRHDLVEGFWGDAGASIDAYYEVNDFVRKHGANHGPLALAGVAGSAA